MRLSFFLREAMRSLRRSALPSFAALATVLVTMLVLGVFIPIVQATTGAANEVRGRLLLDVYLKTGAKPSDIQRVQALLQKTPHVKKIHFVSKAQAYWDERRRNPQAYQLLGSNPLPDTFRVTPDHAGNLNRVRDAILPVGATGRRGPADPSIDEVKNRRDERLPAALPPRARSPPSRTLPRHASAPALVRPARHAGRAGGAGAAVGRHLPGRPPRRPPRAHPRRPGVR